MAQAYPASLLPGGIGMSTTGNRLRALERRMTPQGRYIVFTAGADLSPATCHRAIAAVVPDLNDGDLVVCIKRFAEPAAPVVLYRAPPLPL